MLNKKRIKQLLGHFGTRINVNECYHVTVAADMNTLRKGNPGYVSDSQIGMFKFYRGPKDEKQIVESFDTILVMDDFGDSPTYICLLTGKVFYDEDFTSGEINEGRLTVVSSEPIGQWLDREEMGHNNTVSAPKVMKMVLKSNDKHGDIGQIDREQTLMGKIKNSF